MSSRESRGAAAADKHRQKNFEKVFEQIYRLVLRIPRGHVMTYGQVARLLDERYSPRLVGWAMHATPRDGREIPWHRVINSQGGISTGKVILEQPELQRLLLEAEGVIFDERGKCDLAVYQWSPGQRKFREAIRLARTGSRVSAAQKTTGSRRKRRGANR